MELFALGKRDAQQFGLALDRQRMVSFDHDPAFTGTDNAVSMRPLRLHRQMPDKKIRNTLVQVRYGLLAVEGRGICQKMLINAAAL